MQKKKAENGTRTQDPFITSEVLYQLSYFSLCSDTRHIIPYFIKNARKIFILAALFSVLALTEIYVMIGEYEYSIYITR